MAAYCSKCKSWFCEKENGVSKRHQYFIPFKKQLEKEFTVNLDVRMFGKDAQDVIKKVDRLMKDNKYWLGDINEFGC